MKNEKAESIIKALNRIALALENNKSSQQQKIEAKAHLHSKIRAVKDFDPQYSAYLW